MKAYNQMHKKTQESMKFAGTVQLRLNNIRKYIYKIHKDMSGDVASMDFVGAIHGK